MYAIRSYYEYWAMIVFNALIPQLFWFKAVRRRLWVVFVITSYSIHYTKLYDLMVIVFGAVQIIDNILFQPLIYSNSVKAHPLEIFLVIMAAGSFAGIVGMILAIPVYTILRVVAKEFSYNFV